jgi:hypothetical protein
MKSTARSLQYLKATGWTPALVERRLPRVFVTVDAWGFADIIALRLGSPITAIQSCQSDLQIHLRSIEANEAAKLWLVSGGGIEVQSWRKLKVKRGGVAIKWQVKRMRAYLQHPDGPFDDDKLMGKFTRVAWVEQ